MDNYKIFFIQLSACAAETFTYPIDYIKTLIQVKSNKTSFKGRTKVLFRCKHRLG